MKKQFLPVLALSAILFSTVSCSLGNDKRPGIDNKPNPDINNPVDPDNGGSDVPTPNPDDNKDPGESLAPLKNLIETKLVSIDEYGVNIYELVYEDNNILVLAKLISVDGTYGLSVVNETNIDSNVTKSDRNTYIVKGIDTGFLVSNEFIPSGKNVHDLIKERDGIFIDMSEASFNEYLYGNYSFDKKNVRYCKFYSEGTLVDTITASRDDNGIFRIDRPIEYMPDKEGKYFAGWVDKDGNEVDLFNLTGEVTEFYTKYIDKLPTFKVTFKYKGETLKTLEVNEHDPIGEYIGPGEINEYFKYWDLNGMGFDTLYDPVHSDITLNAVTEPINNGTNEVFTLNNQDPTTIGTIASLMEKKAIDSNIAEIPLASFDKKFATNDRLSQIDSKPTMPNYHPHYVENGNIERPAELLDSNANESYKMYYHGVITDPLSDFTSCYSEYNDLRQFYAGRLFNKALVRQNYSYKYYPSLALEKPFAAYDSVTNKATTFEVQIKTDDTAVYRTLNPALSEYENKPIKVEDYFTILDAYYKNKLDSDVFSMLPVQFDKNGSLSDHFEITGKDTFIARFNAPLSEEEFMDLMSSFVFTPLPQEFLTKYEKLDTYGKFKDGLFDILSTGPYLFEEANKERVVLKRNEKFADFKNVDDEVNSRFKIPGLYFVVRDPSFTETDAVNSLKQGLLDEVEIYNHPDKNQFVHSFTGKNINLALNTTTRTEWDNLYQNIFRRDKNHLMYTVEPIMSNDYFIKGLRKCFNRDEFYEKFNYNGSTNLISDDVILDREHYVNYNESYWHKNLIKENEHLYSYDLAEAKSCFNKAVYQVISEGLYQLPCEVNLSLYSDFKDKTFVQYIAKTIEDTFNDLEVSNGKFKIKVDIFNEPNYPNEYDIKRIKTGAFDMAITNTNLMSFTNLNPVLSLAKYSQTNIMKNTVSFGENINSGFISKDGFNFTFDEIISLFRDTIVIDNGYALNDVFKLTYISAYYEDLEEKLKISFNIKKTNKVNLNFRVSKICYFDKLSNYFELKTNHYAIKQDTLEADKYYIEITYHDLPNNLKPSVTDNNIHLKNIVLRYEYENPQSKLTHFGYVK